MAGGPEGTCPRGADAVITGVRSPPLRDVVNPSSRALRGKPGK